MAYTFAGIINLALGRIGIKRVAEHDYPLTESSPQAIEANAIWQYVRDEVLEAKDWKFAKKRAAIGKVAEAPPSGYDFAYLVPTDFLRITQGTEDDPGIYPAGYPYKFETMDVIGGSGGVAEFNPAAAGAYTSAAASRVRIGRYAEINVGTAGATAEKILYIAGTYKQSDITFIDIECETNSSDALSVTASGHTITIKLAMTTGASNTAAAIQAAIRAIAGGTVDGVSILAWTVTQNAAYLANYPTTGIDIAAIPMGNGDKVYECILNITGTAANTSKFPAAETTYWEEVEPSAALCLVTDYDNEESDEELVLTYIRRVTDVTLFSPSFINALAFRLAAEMAIRLTEGPNKFKGMMELYFLTLTKADEVNQSLDYFDVIDNWGNDKNASWEKAGRQGSQQ